MSSFEQVTSLPLMLFYGQSWMQSNSYNGRVLAHNPHPDHAWMLRSAQNALVTRERGPISAGFDGFCPALDESADMQSVVAPFLYRYAAEALQDERPAHCVGHSGAVSGARLERLLPEGDPACEDSVGFGNLMQAVRAHVDAAALGKGAHVPFVVFCQGAGNRTMAKEDYSDLLEHLLDVLQARICDLTGQDAVPHVLMVQPPGKGNGGAWPCLQAQVELCARREDMTLAVSGWAVEQHDRIHFSGQGAVAVGELCAIVARGVERGVSCGAPWIESVRRRGKNRLVLKVQASGALTIDTSRQSPRHAVRGQPVPDFGFEAACNSIRKVVVCSRKVIVKFDDEAPDAVTYAYHNGADYVEIPGEKANQSANRGNLRLKKGWKSMFLDATLHHWLASSHLRLNT